jgi:hypothetical protein
MFILSEQELPRAQEAYIRNVGTEYSSIDDVRRVMPQGGAMGRRPPQDSCNSTRVSLRSRGTLIRSLIKLTYPQIKQYGRFFKRAALI